MTYQFKIKIKGITKPPVWRVVTVPDYFTFLEFHEVIQIAFGWEDDHLFEFREKEYQGDLCISLPNDFDFDSSGESLDASKTKLHSVFNDSFQKLLYVYDFGDDWVHEILLEKTIDDNQKVAICLSGKGACPPEDCGGVYRYEHIKKIFQTKPKSEEANQYRDWLDLNEDEVWDADLFDIDEVNDCLK